MTRGPVPDPWKVIEALRANNDLLRGELRLAGARKYRAFWRGAATATGIIAASAALLWSLPAFAGDTASWMGTGCQLIPVTGQDHIAEVRCVNVETMGDALTEGVMAVPGLFVGLTVLHGPGDIPDRFTITPEPGFIAVPPVLVIGENQRATALIMQWIGG